jgi:hypothetical protein
MWNGRQKALRGGQARPDRKAGGAARRRDRPADRPERDRTGLLAAEAYMIVHHPQWQRAKEWLQAGEIGTLRHVRRGVFSST